MRIRRLQKKKASSHWIIDADDDEQRFVRIEQYLRGFDQPMWEVGERYNQMKEAVSRNNPDLAIYHWKKIRKTILNGLMKRPARSANAHKMFLDELWPHVLKDLEVKTKDSLADAMVEARSACMACHIAEKVSFVNNQPMFDSQ